MIDPGSRDARSRHSTIFETVDPTVIDTAIAILTAQDHFRSVQASLYDHPVFRSATPAESSVLRNSIEGLRAGLRAFIGSIKNIFSIPDPEAEGDARPGVPTIGELRAGLTVNQERRSRIISVSYTDKSPEKAAAIVNQFVDLHVNELRDRNRRQAELSLAWLDQRLVEVKSEVQQAEERVQSFRIVHGLSNIEADAELIAQTRRQLARAKSEAMVGEAAVDTPRGNEAVGKGGGENGEPAPEPGPVSDLENELPQARLNNEAEIIRSQASMMEQYLESLQSDAAGRLASEAELRFLERQGAAAAKHYDDLLQRKQDIAEDQDRSTVATQVLASARVPTRPSSINPILFIPAGLIAFSAFGGAIAVVLERMDRTLRSERDIVDALGVSCIGLVPNIPWIYRRQSPRYLFDGVSSAYGQAIYSIMAATLQPAGPRAEPMVILVTSSVPGEGKTTLATSFAACAARLGRRALLVDGDLKDPDTAAAFEMVAHENAGHALPPEDTSAGPIGRIPDLDCDYLPVRRTGTDQPSLVVAQKIVDICQRLRGSYDCVIIDGLPTFAAETRLLSAVADKVIFAVRWGSTRREVAGNALQQLRHTNRFDSLANVHAVLTRVHLRKHAQYRLGDMGEFLQKHRKHYSRSGLWS
ncbi:GumC family protein [Mesorhizobium escarrei]|nr:tyrosine-protein kinase domain-containing protein [Mesorhizobium escarrei]